MVVMSHYRLVSHQHAVSLSRSLSAENEYESEHEHERQRQTTRELVVGACLRSIHGITSWFSERGRLSPVTPDGASLARNIVVDPRQRHPAHHQALGLSQSATRSFLCSTTSVYWYPTSRHVNV